MNNTTQPEALKMLSFDTWTKIVREKSQFMFNKTLFGSLGIFFMLLCMIMIRFQVLIGLACFVFGLVFTCLVINSETQFQTALEGINSEVKVLQIPFAILPDGRGRPKGPGFYCYVL